MQPVGTWRVDATKILTRRELAAVLADLTRRARRSPGACINLMLVRLACCCGLRASEIAGLRLRDVHVAGDRPHIYIRREIAKCGHARRVPLWWDAGTLADLGAWLAHRADQGATARDPVLCSLQKNQSGAVLSRHALRRRFKTACKVIETDGGERRDERRSFRRNALTGATIRTKRARSASCRIPNNDGNIKIRPEGLEPPTLGSEDRCSIQLSYGRVRTCS